MLSNFTGEIKNRQTEQLGLAVAKSYAKIRLHGTPSSGESRAVGPANSSSDGAGDVLVGVHEGHSSKDGYGRQDLKKRLPFPFVRSCILVYNSPGMEQAESSKKFQVWLGIGVSALSLVALFIFIKPAEIAVELKNARISLIGIAFLGILVFMILRAFRWRFMLNNEISWRQTFHIQNIGYMLTMLLPLRAGDLARAVLIGSVPPVTLARGISTMVVERLLDMLFIVTMLPFTLAEADRLPDWMQAGARGSGVAALGAILILILAANQRPFTLRIAKFILNKITFLNTANWLKRIDDMLIGLNNLTRWKDGLILIAYSIIIWLPILFSYRTVMQAVNLQPTWAMTGFVVAAAALSIAAPSSPGQIGVFHAGVTAALVFLNQDKNVAASFAIIYHALNLITMVILGSFGLLGTGATFGEVIATTRQFARRKS